MRNPTPLQPFINYYGGKARVAHLYPPPKYGTIIEPFAGAAGYSIAYPHKDVILYDLHEPVVRMWEYLIKATETEILSLPNIKLGQTVSDLDVCEEARILIGWMVGTSAKPANKPTVWMKWDANHPRLFQDEKVLGRSNFWGQKRKERIARQLSSIRHWKVKLASYTDIEDVEATWFIDPPYCNKAGRAYTHGADGIDYQHLAKWCHSRSGQVIVCENEGAEWLPFAKFRTIHSAQGLYRSGKSHEVIWTKNCDPEPSIFK